MRKCGGAALHTTLLNLGTGAAGFGHGWAMIEYEGYAEAIVGGARIRNLDSGGEQVLELVRRDEFPSRGLAASCVPRAPPGR